MEGTLKSAKPESIEEDKSEGIGEVEEEEHGTRAELTLIEADEDEDGVEDDTADANVDPDIGRTADAIGALSSGIFSASPMLAMDCRVGGRGGRQLDERLA